MSDIVNKLWGFCHTLRHDGVDYGDYIEQLTYLLFLKMADEKDVALPKDCTWETLKSNPARPFSISMPISCGSSAMQKGFLGDIFAQSMPRFNNPVNLKRLLP